MAYMGCGGSGGSGDQVFDDSEYILVAGSDAPQAVKDKTEYVATGSGDQALLNEEVFPSLWDDRPIKLVGKLVIDEPLSSGNGYKLFGDYSPGVIQISRNFVGDSVFNANWINKLELENLHIKSYYNLSTPYIFPKAITTNEVNGISIENCKMYTGIEINGGQDGKIVNCEIQSYVATNLIQLNASSYKILFNRIRPSTLNPTDTAIVNNGYGNMFFGNTTDPFPIGLDNTMGDGTIAFGNLGFEDIPYSLGSGE